MKNITIIDFSAVLHGSIHSIFKDKTDWDINQETGKKSVKLEVLRPGLLGSLLYYKNIKHKADECIIAIDRAPYWRKDILPFYKGMRKKGREESDIDWKTVFEHVETIIKEIDNHLPWHVVAVQSLEADDVIGILSPRINQDANVCIISADGDLVQLQQYPNIRQWSPITKKFVTPKVDAITDLHVKIIKGDSGDGIPNIYSDADLFLARSEGDSVRQKPVSAKLITEAAQTSWDPKRFLQNDTFIANFHRNKMLVDFSSIPNDLVHRCWGEYRTQCVRKYNAMDMQMYLAKHRMKRLIDSANEF
jgi:hypothetical protein